MEEKNKTKHYVKDDLTIVWDSGKCIHSAVCIKMLPRVYNPKARPWIKPEHASVDELKRQIDRCPSAALSYIENNQPENTNEMKTEIELMKNGPLLVKGDVVITSPDGSVVTKEKKTFFCRCGASGNKPFCDGSHKKEGFEG